MPWISKLILSLLAGLFLAGCATAPYQHIHHVSGGVYHIVTSGQTLYSISKVYGVDIKEIMLANKISDPGYIGAGEKLFIPKRRPLQLDEGQVYKTVPAVFLTKIVGLKQYKIRWQTITLHHSATEEGNAEAFDINHRNRGMGGLAYHFVIGNGTGSGNGEIEVGWRWKKQVETNRKRDIQICLVGNFNKQQVSDAQFKSLIQLIKILKSQYDISILRIRRHKDVPGAITECPGKNFPFFEIKQELVRK